MQLKFTLMLITSALPIPPVRLVRPYFEVYFVDNHLDEIHEKISSQAIFEICFVDNCLDGNSGKIILFPSGFQLSCPILILPMLQHIN